MTTPSHSPIPLSEEIQYGSGGIYSKVLFKDSCCQLTLFCLGQGTEISEHTSSRNATVQVLEGSGILTLEAREIALTPGLLIFMPARAPHALNAHENLSFLLTLSEAAKD